MEPQAEWKIGEVASGGCVRRSTLRYYESVGLLPAPRRQGGQRYYDQEVFHDLDLIRVGKAAGFTVRDLVVFRKALDSGAAPSKTWRMLAGRRLPEVQALIRRVRVMEKLLKAGLSCGCEALADCYVPRALGP